MRLFTGVLGGLGRKNKGKLTELQGLNFLEPEVGGFLVTTRDHGSFGGCHQVEILPTGLPELFKPARDLLEPRKFEILGPKFSS